MKGWNTPSNFKYLAPNGSRVILILHMSQKIIKHMNIPFQGLDWSKSQIYNLNFDPDKHGKY